MSSSVATRNDVTVHRCTMPSIAPAQRARPAMFHSLIVTREAGKIFCKPERRIAAHILRLFAPIAEIRNR
jgi:hypothetical protein